MKDLNKNIKLVCLDLDGTINDDWGMLPELESYLWTVRVDNFIRTALTSGRDPLGVLYYVWKTGVQFDYLGTGGGGIIDNMSSFLWHPCDTATLFTHVTIQSITQACLSKTDRIVAISKLVKAKPEEVIYIDDNPVDGDFSEIRTKLVGYRLGSPASNNRDWVNYVLATGGIYSPKPCGEGTLDILKAYLET